MIFTHEVGHILGGWCCGAKLAEFDLRPWRLPYSFFAPDPHPLVTLWSGPIVGVIFPVVVAMAVRRDCVWLIAYFCVLANGCYIAAGWYSGDPHLDTTKLLRNGASPISIAIFCGGTIVPGYLGFRRYGKRLFLAGSIAIGGRSDSHANTTVSDDD